MRMKILTGAAALALVIPFAAHAQGGAAAGAAAGAAGGAVVGGPVGAAVGGVGGAIVGGIADENKPKFREYVVKEHHPLTVIRVKSWSAASCRRPASPITRCRRNMARHSTAGRS